MADLTFPIEPPTIGSSVAIADCVAWIRLPLPSKLHHINVWALDDGDGWTLVDTGVRSEETTAAWAALRQSGRLATPLKRVIVTHMHADHLGLAGWFTSLLGVRLWITRLEYLSCRNLASDIHRDPPADALKFYAQAGWECAAIDGYRTRFTNSGRHVHPLPDSYRRMRDTEQLMIGRHPWEVVIGSGHSPEHACLYSPDLKMLISGDQVLPKISSNVSVHPTEPDADPMQDWLESLDKMQARVPDDVLVLPAHGACFRGLHARIEVLRKDQLDALQRLRDRLAQPARVVDVFEDLFGRRIRQDDASQLGLATGEAVAALNHLCLRGEATREIRNGIAWYYRTERLAEPRR
jgi:glyoxylase-like metal-dependent hydrolase (beta-lactamase superfamily II)